MNHWIDSHAHLSGGQTWPEISAILQRAQAAGIEHVINICTDADSLNRGLELASGHPWIYNTGATTPHDVDKEGELLFPVFAAEAKNGNLIAIGETGLDYHYAHSAKETQKQFLVKYLHLALECRLPVVIHCREAFHDLFAILDAEYTVNGALAPGVLHCFTGTLQEAENVFERGWYLSLSGIVTFKNSAALQAVAKMAPLEQLLIETDTPYLAPQSKRGKPNEPSYLPEIGHMIAQMKGISLQEVAAATRNNAKKLFGLL